MLKKPLLVTALLLALSAPALAQGHLTQGVVSADERAVLAVVDRLFDGMRAGDSAAVRSVFHPEIRMVTSFRREGRPMVGVEENLDEFVQMVGTPHPEVFDERIWNLLVLTDDDFAMAWMDYAFYLGDRFSHCGIDLMELVRTEEGWKIIGLADTRRRDGCDVPDYLTD